MDQVFFQMVTNELMLRKNILTCSLKKLLKKLKMVENLEVLQQKLLLSDLKNLKKLMKIFLLMKTFLKQKKENFYSLLKTLETKLITLLKLILPEQDPLNLMKEWKHRYLLLKVLEVTNIEKMEMKNLKLKQKLLLHLTVKMFLKSVHGL